MKKNFNFLKNALTPEEGDSAFKTFLIKVSRALVYPLIFTGVFVLVFSFQVLLSNASFGENVSDGIKKFSFLNVLGITNDKPLRGEDEDRINILLTGMGGLGHDGPFLTDTIILVSIKPSTNQISMLSVPRDLSIPIPNYGWKKINSVNHYGEMAEAGSGAQFSSEVLSGVFDQPIHYYLRVDFAGFVDLVNELGGLDVYVDRSFVDYQFPADNYAYQTVKFEKGWTKMDGEAALNFTRSRHGNNGEGSDFARSQRQQKVIKAFKEKALSLNTLLSPGKLGALYDSYKNSVSMNMEPWEMLRFAKIAKNLDDNHINTYVLDDSPDGLLYSTIINEAYLLLPRDQTFGTIKRLIANIFLPQDALNRNLSASIEVRNGTKIEGLASKAASLLKTKGFDISLIANAERQDFEQTVIYDFTKGQKPELLTKLKAELNANVSVTLPEWLNETDNTNSVSYSKADFLVILGKDETIIKD